jgi:hypothetical protein
VIDAQPLTEKACIRFKMRPRQTSMMVALCFVYVLNVGMRRITLDQESFRATCFGLVLCLAIMFGPSTEKEGL